MKVTIESKPSPQIIERDCRNVMGRKAGYSARNNRRTLRKGMWELTSGQAIADGYERSGTSG